jgi:hypothetical protein
VISRRRRRLELTGECDFSAAIFSAWIFAVAASVPLARSVTIFRLLSDIGNVRQLLDCALHDMRRDKAGIECYAMPPRFAKKYEAMKDCNANAAQVYGGNVRRLTKNQNDRHRGHLKRGTAPLISLLDRDVGMEQTRLNAS